MAMEMLGLVMRHDIRMPRAAVELFTKNLISETLQVRKVSENYLIQWNETSYTQSRKIF